MTITIIEGTTVFAQYELDYRVTRAFGMPFTDIAIARKSPAPTFEDGRA